MSTSLSVAEILTRLEAQIAHHRGRQAYHLEQEAFHREQGAQHAAELETLAQRFEAFKTSAAAVLEFSDLLPAPPPALEDFEIGRKPKISRLIVKVIAGKAAGETFGASGVTAELNRRLGQKLRRPVDPRMVSLALRRFHERGEIRQVREGRPHHEALYSRLERS
jgi:hypothetical protein